MYLQINLIISNLTKKIPMVITTINIQLFQILRQKLGDKEAGALVGFVDAKLKDSNEQNLKVVATKEYLAYTKAEMIKWMFIFWIGTIGVLSGIMTLLLKAYIKH